MEWVKLGEFITQVRGVSYKPSDIIDEYKTGYVPLLRANAIQNNKLNNDDIIYVDESKVKEEQILQPEDILIAASSGSKSIVGKAAQFLGLGRPYTFGAFCRVIRPIGINPTFLKYYFMSSYYRTTISHLASGANINNIRAEMINDLDTPKISVSKQLYVSNILSSCESLIAKRREQIDALDALVGSVFNELEKAVEEKVKLKELTKINPQKSEVKELDPNTLVSFVPMEDVSETGELHLSRERPLGEVYKGFTYFKDGDVVVAKITPCFENGKGALMKDLVNGIGFGTTEFHVLRAKDLSRLNPIWLFNVTRSKRFNVYGEMQMTGSAGQKRIPKSFLEDFEITLPPIALQNRFADYVTSIEAQKESLRSSLAELETLFDALMQAAFSGL